MAVLVLTTVLPSDRRGGGEIVSQGIVDALADAGNEVRVLGYRRRGRITPSAPGEIVAGTRPIETSEAGLRAALWALLAVASRAPYSVAKYRSRAYLHAARGEARAGVAAVVADHAQVEFATRAIAQDGPPMAFVAHNAEARMYAATADAESRRARRWLAARESRLIARRERDLARRARQIWVLSGDDADYFAALVPGADVRLIPPVAASIAEADATDPDYDVGLIGNWTWQPNVLGLRWFVDEVVPRLPRGLTVRVAGGGCDWLRGRHPNVDVLGRVEDAERFHASARVIAVPAVAGGGVQIKTLDAIATGLPVVVSPTAVRGVGSLPGSVTVADDAEDFAAQIVRVAADGHARSAMRDEALAWTRGRRSHFDASVAEWVAELAGEPAPAVAAQGSPARLR